MPDADRQAGRVPLAPVALGQLVARIDDGTISGKIAKELLPELIASGKAPDALIAEKGLVQVSDEEPIREAARRVIDENPQQAATYRGGKTATLGWFVGQVMKATGGRANPAVVNKVLRELLGP
jgi:aspartyl-tRNA(Asn)/glutamyl-tRNA(Gln) amidotransferase subunit B